MKPILKYRGGKRKEIPLFFDYIPTEYDTYIEPFVGGGALYFDLAPSKAIINDINQKLYLFYKDMQENFYKIKNELTYLGEIYQANQLDYEKEKQRETKMKILHKNEALYYEMRKEFNSPSGKWSWGTIYYFINKTAYSGMIRYNKKGEFNVPFGRYRTFNPNLITNEHHTLLKQTQIHNSSYENIFEKAGKNDFIFLDPPYDCTFNEYGNEVFTGSFDKKEQERLAAHFKNLKTPTLMIINKSPITTTLYKSYIVEEYHKNYSVNIKNYFKSEAIHYIIANY